MTLKLLLAQCSTVWATEIVDLGCRIMTIDQVYSANGLISNASLPFLYFLTHYSTKGVKTNFLKKLIISFRKNALNC